MAKQNSAVCQDCDHGVWGPRKIGVVIHQPNRCKL